MTAKRVAKDLGVSEATVSLAVNNKPGVNPETRARVLAHIDMLKSESSVKRGASGERIKVVCFQGSRGAYDEEKASLFSVMVHEFFRSGRKHGCELKLAYGETREDMQNIVADSVRDGTAGILLCASDMGEEEFAPFVGCGVPLMVFDNEFERMDCDSTVIDNERDVLVAMRHLRDMGHQDIVCFRNSLRIHNFDRRLETFQRCMREVSEHIPGRTFDAEASVLTAGSRIEDIHESVKNWISTRKSLPTAILCENYAISIGAVKALQDAGLRIPGDISVIGIDELPSYALLDFRLTHVRIPHARKATLAINRLVERMRTNPEEVVQIRVISHLVEGDSVADLNVFK